MALPMFPERHTRVPLTQAQCPLWWKWQPCVGWGGETGGRPGRELPCRATLCSHPQLLGRGRRRWVGRGAPSSDMPFLPNSSRQPPSPSHAPPNTALRSQTAWELGACWQQTPRSGLTGELVGVAGSEARVTSAGVGRGLETRVT